MKKGKNNKPVSLLPFIASIVFYICAIISFMDGGSMGAAYLCLGSTFLCLGTVWLNRGRNEDDKDDKSNE